MRRVFIDTSAFFALGVSQDRNHARARELFSEADRESWRFITTNAVVFETHALLLNRARAGRDKALEFLGLVEADSFFVVRVSKGDEERAIALVRAHVDKSYSLCDALSFAVMERLGIKEAVAFDRDFLSYGRFAVL